MRLVDEVREQGVQCVVAAFVEVIAFLGRCFVHVRCCVLLVIVVMKCSTGIMRACGGANKALTIE